MMHETNLADCVYSWDMLDKAHYRIVLLFRQKYMELRYVYSGWTLGERFGSIPLLLDMYAGLIRLIISIAGNTLMLLIWQ